MSDEITSGVDSMFAVGAPTWHGKETLRDVVTWEEAFTLSGIKTPKLEPVFAQVNGVIRPVEDRKAITVEGQNEPLAIVSNRYTLMEPRRAFDVLDEVVKSGAASYETAGTFRQQRVMWGLLKLNESFKVGRKDAIQPYIFVTDFRDGSGAARFGNILTRVVCANTHATALRENGVTRIKHAKGINERVEEAARILGLIRTNAEAAVEVYNALANRPVSAKDAKAFLADLMPLPELPKEKGRMDAYEIARTRIEAERATVYDVYEHSGVGIDLAGHTAWGLFNAVTQWVDHAKHPTANANNRLYMRTLGVGADLKQTAYQTLAKSL